MPDTASSASASSKSGGSAKLGGKLENGKAKSTARDPRKLSRETVHVQRSIPVLALVEALLRLRARMIEQGRLWRE